MANFSVIEPTEIEHIDWQGIADKGVASYEKVEEKRNKEGLAEAMTAIPESVTTESLEDTEQSKMLEEESFGPDESGALPESEKSAQDSAKKTKRMTTRDWKAHRAKGAKFAAKIGPDAVVKFDEYVTKQQMEGFHKGGQQASIHLLNNDMAAAKNAIEDAYSYYPDGVRTELQIVQDPKTGKDMLVGMGYDEETNKFNGAMALTPKNIGSFMTMVSDPMKFTANTLDRSDKMKKQALEERTAGRADDTASRQDKQLALNERRVDLEAARDKAKADNLPLEVEKLEAEIKKLEAQTRKEEALAKSGGSAGSTKDWGNDDRKAFTMLYGEETNADYEAKYGEGVRERVMTMASKLRRKYPQMSSNERVRMAMAAYRRAASESGAIPPE